MVDWLSPLEIARDADIFSKLMHVLLGLYIWEFLVSLPFDWQFISGKKKFRWPLVVYFVNRYSLLFALIGITIALNVTTEINCQVLYTFNAIAGNFAIGTASINLSLRTIAIWSQSWYIITPLVLVIMGHWSLLLHGVVLRAAWVPEAGCVITSTDTTILAATFIYSMCFDLLVLLLTGWKLVAFPGAGGGAAAMGRSRLVTLIFRDGLIYFLIAFLANLAATVFMLLNLNPVMSIIANVPACIASSIVACRAVRRLTNYTTSTPEVFATTTQGSTLAFRSGVRHKLSMKDGVHVHMQTFEHTSDKSYVEFDAAGRPRAVVIGGMTDRTGLGDVTDVDSEAQAISGDFKRPPY